MLYSVIVGETLLRTYNRIKNGFKKCVQRLRPKNRM